MKTLIFLMLFSMANTTSCENLIPDTSLKTDTISFFLKMKEEVKIEQENITLKFDSVLSDSRCPKNVTCIWAGEVKVAILVNNQIYSLKLNDTLAISNTKILLAEVNPYPEAGKEIAPSDYILKMTILK